MVYVAAGGHEHPAQHEEFPLGEVHDAGGVVDDGKAERYQGIDAADG